MGRHLALLAVATLIAAPSLLAPAQALTGGDALEEAQAALPLAPSEAGDAHRDAPPPQADTGDADPGPSIDAGPDDVLEERGNAVHEVLEDDPTVEDILSLDDVEQTLRHAPDVPFSIEEAPLQVGLVLVDPAQGDAEPTPEENGHVVAKKTATEDASPDASNVLLVVLPAAAATLTGTVAATGSTAWLRRLIPGVPLWSLYSRIERTDVLDHEARESVCDVLKATPGLSIREIAETLGVARSTARHHVRVLQDADLVDSTTVGRCRIHYPVGCKAEAIRRHMLKNENRARVARAIRSDARSVSELAELLGENVGAVHFHVNKLCEAGLAKRRENGRVTYTSTRGDDGEA